MPLAAEHPSRTAARASAAALARASLTCVVSEVLHARHSSAFERVAGVVDTARRDAAARRIGAAQPLHAATLFASSNMSDNAEFTAALATRLVAETTPYVVELRPGEATASASAASAALMDGLLVADARHRAAGVTAAAWGTMLAGEPSPLLAAATVGIASALRDECLVPGLHHALVAWARNRAACASATASTAPTPPAVVVVIHNTELVSAAVLEHLVRAAVTAAGGAPTVLPAILFILSSCTSRAMLLERLTPLALSALTLHEVALPSSVNQLRATQDALFAAGLLPLRLGTRVQEMLADDCAEVHNSVSNLQAAVGTLVSAHYAALPPKLRGTVSAARSSSGGGGGGGSSGGGAPVSVTAASACLALALPTEQLAAAAAGAGFPNALSGDTPPASRFEVAACEVWGLCTSMAAWLDADEVASLFALPSMAHADRLSMCAASLARDWVQVALAASQAAAKLPAAAAALAAYGGDTAALAAACSPPPPLRVAGATTAATLAASTRRLSAASAAAAAAAPAATGRAGDGSSVAPAATRGYFWEGYVHEHRVVDERDADTGVFGVRRDELPFCRPRGMATDDIQPLLTSPGVRQVVAVLARAAHDIRRRASRAGGEEAGMSAADAGTTVHALKGCEPVDVRRTYIAMALLRHAAARQAWLPVVAVMRAAARGRAPPRAGGEEGEPVTDLYTAGCGGNLADGDVDDTLARARAALGAASAHTLATFLAGAISTLLRGVTLGAAPRVLGDLLGAAAAAYPPPALFAGALAAAAVLLVDAAAAAAAAAVEASAPPPATPGTPATPGDAASLPTSPPGSGPGALQRQLAAAAAGASSSLGRRHAVMAAVQSSSRGPVESRLASLRSRVTGWLVALVAEHTAPISSLPLGEAATFTDTAAARRLLRPSPLEALFRALRNPHGYGECVCCAPRVPGAANEDLVVAYAALLEAMDRRSHRVAAQDWWVAFRTAYAADLLVARGGQVEDIDGEPAVDTAASDTAGGDTAGSGGGGGGGGGEGDAAEEDDEYGGFSIRRPAAAAAAAAKHPDGAGSKRRGRGGKVNSSGKRPRKSDADALPTAAVLVDYSLYHALEAEAAAAFRIAVEQLTHLSVVRVGRQGAGDGGAAGWPPASWEVLTLDPTDAFRHAVQQ